MSVKILCIVLTACLPYIFSIDGDFVFDDSEAIVKNKDVTSDSWTDPFFNDFWGTDIKSNLSHKSYRPLTILSFRLNYLFNKRSLNSRQFKIVNSICHIICCLVLWKAIKGIIEGTHKPLYQDTGTNKKSHNWWMDRAYMSTLLFALHPIHTEAVCGIVGRADLLAGITFFLAFICYHKSMASHNCKYMYLLSTVVISAISMLCKENGVTVLGYCLVYELITKVRIKKKCSSNEKDILLIENDTAFRMIVIITAIFGLLYVRWTVMGGSKPEFKPTDNPAAFATSSFTKLATYNYIYFLNMLLLFWPQWLCYDWSMGCIKLVETMSDNRIILVFLMYFYAFLLIITIFSRKTYENRLMVMAVALIIIPFLPASNIFYPVGFVIAERILYIPSAGYCILVVIGFNQLLHKRKLIVCKVGVFMFSLLLVFYFARILQRSADWNKEFDLFVKGLSVCPRNAKVRYNVAKAVHAKDMTSWALDEYKEAIRLYPDYYQAMNNLANLLKDQREFSEAEFYLKATLNRKTDFPAAWMNLGIVLASTGRFNDSEGAYKNAISYRKKYPDCYYNLGNLYLELNRTEDAIHSWIQAIKQNPKHILAWTNLLALMDNTGQIERALKIIPKVLTELPDAPSINFAIANMYGKLNRFSEAESHFVKAIKYDKKAHAIYFANLGVLYHRWKRYYLAEEMYIKALEVDPMFKTAIKNLESLMKMKK